MARSRVDVALGAAGLAMAGAAIWFPWHVYVSPHEFGAPQMQLTRYDDDTAGFDIASLALTRPTVGPTDTTLSGNIDRTTTGSIGKANAAAAPIVVLFTVPDRAIVRRHGRLELWQAGTVVGGDVRVVSIAQDALVLSDGRKLRPSGPHK